MAHILIMHARKGILSPIYQQKNALRMSRTGRVAYVLPKDYAYGFRGPNDKIWGLWEADALSNKTCITINSLMKQYGNGLDIIYDDNLSPINTQEYRKLIFWNGTINDR